MSLIIFAPELFIIVFVFLLTAKIQLAVVIVTVQYISNIQCILLQLAPGVEYLLHAYPEYVTIDSLPLDDESSRVGLLL